MYTELSQYVLHSIKQLFHYDTSLIICVEIRGCRIKRVRTGCFIFRRRFYLKRAVRGRVSLSSAQGMTNLPDLAQYTGSQHTAFLCQVQYNTVHSSTVQCSTVHYSTVQYSPMIQYITVQYSSVQYSIVY